MTFSVFFYGNYIDYHDKIHKDVQTLSYYYTKIHSFLTSSLYVIREQTNRQTDKNYDKLFLASIINILIENSICFLYFFLIVCRVAENYSMRTSFVSQQNIPILYVLVESEIKVIKVESH